MKPRPRAEDEKYRGSGKLRSKVALITGGDSGIGGAVAIAFAKEGANISVVYLEEQKMRMKRNAWWKNTWQASAQSHALEPHFRT
jgi:NAD(P)-dependent dehydrogenase (short-subunit alcohol dehydrogenase family)